MEYENYTVIDFTLDETFVHWVKQTDESSDKFWTGWLAQHPHKRAEVEEARCLILGISTCIEAVNLGENPPAVLKLEMQKLLKELMKRIHNTAEGLSRAGKTEECNERQG